MRLFTQIKFKNLGLFWILGFSASMLTSSGVQAIDSFSATDLSGLSSANVSSLLETVAIGASHRAYMPASPLRNWGFDVGLDVTAITIPEDFKTALALASGSTASSISSVLPLPKLNIHKGLPWGLDLGFSYSSYQGLFQIIGGEIKWAFLNGAGPKPAVALRLSGNSSDLFFMHTSAYALDLVVSKSMFIIEPYLGAGMQLWSGSLDVDTSVLSTAGVGLATTASSTAMHVFVGLPIKLLILRVTPEYDYSFSGIKSYGMKVSLGI